MNTKSRLFLVTIVLGVIAVTLAAQNATTGADAKQPAFDSYIAIMELPPAVAYDGQLADLEATRPGKGRKINPNSAHVRHYTEFLERTHGDALAASGASQLTKSYSYTYALNGFAARLTEAQATELAKQPGVSRVQRDTLRRKMTDTSPAFLNLNNAIDGGVWGRGLTGEDVVIGVIDSGIWPEHPSFADDGSYGPPPVVLADLPGHPACEFGNTVHNPDDAPFTCNNKLIGARVYLDTYRFYIGLDPGEFDSARDNDGHGTHNASVAGGNGGVESSIFGVPRGWVSGVAPRARIVAYKALGDLGGFNSDLAAAIDQAVADGVDVINYSIGGGASLTGADDIAFLFAADAGVLVSTTAGNSGPGSGTIGGPASVPWITAVGATSHGRAFLSEITLAGPGTPPTGLWGASVTTGIQNYDLVDAEGIADTYGITTGECLRAFPAGTFQATDAVLCNQYTYGISRAERVANVAAGGGGAVLFHNLPTVNTMHTDNYILPAIHMRHEVGQPLKDYLVANPGQVLISFTQGVARYAGEDPRVQPNVMASFSSRGPDPVALDLIKPDVAAPGVSILAGTSPMHTGDQAQGQYFHAYSGTSPANAHTAGAYALIRQAQPDWSAAMAKSALMTTAYRDVLKEDGATPADPFDIGAGRINPGADSTRGSAFQPGLVYHADFNDYLGFLCDAAPEIFANPTATCAALEAAGVPIEAHDLNLPSIGVAEVPGSRTVHRAVNSVAREKGRRTYTVSVDPPPGFTVIVSPESFHLKQHERAEYSVTVINTGAPIGEWRFGSLTWTDQTGKYEVHSPIAVRASLFNAPDVVSGTGTSGSDSFEVGFGYTGSYTAAPHGLVAATVASDNVPQDPDQTFDPLDGYSNSHSFSVSGAAFLRIALPPEATEPDADLDLFVYDPTGVQVATSTSGGTNELVDIVLPMDGTWTVYVHGWLTPGGDSDYDLYTWEVPLASAGSLSVDSAPASATLGTTGTVEISWTGATAGGWHLGAVSHTGDAGLMKLTLVEVDNR